MVAAADGFPVSSHLQTRRTSTLSGLRVSQLEEEAFTVTAETKRCQEKMSLEKEIAELGRRGRTDQALALFASIGFPSVRQVNAAIDACARSQPVRLDRAMCILKSCPYPNVYTFGALMNAISRAGEIKMAVDLLESMQSDYHVRPNAVVYQSAVAAAANAVQPSIALKLLEDAKASGISITVVGYNAAISAAARACDWKLSKYILDSMRDSCDAPDPDSVSYGTVMSAFQKCGEWDRILDLLRDMKERKIPLDGLVLSSALHACQQLGLAEKAVEYFELMKDVESSQHIRYTTGHRQPLEKPDAVAYRLAISACARGGAWQKGIQILEEYIQDGCHDDNDVVAWTAAITGCEYAGAWKEAFALLDRMRRQNVQPNEVTFAAVIGACATACSKLDLERSFDCVNATVPAPQRKALQLLNVLKRDETVPKPNIQVYNAAIRTCAEALDERRAFRLLELLREEGLEPNIITYGSLMTACERVGSIDGLGKVFRMMQDDEIEPNEIHYGAALSCCRKTGESDRAFLLLRKMIKAGLKPNVATFNTVIMAQVESKNVGSKEIERAVSLFKLLYSRDYTFASPNRQTYNILIRALANNQKPREAEALLRRMRQETMVPDVDLYTITVSSYEKTGQPLQALRLMESMREDGYEFYEAAVLNAAFKKAINIANKFGRTWADIPDREELDSLPIVRNETFVDFDL
jgi:pentatricopeptide repeat protein